MTAATAAKQGMYSSVNVRKDTAESGVNSEPRTVESWAVSGTLVSTARVETTASLAERPVSSAVELIQLPKPRGAKTGAMNRPMPASMLSLLSLTIIRRVSKLCRTQMTMDAMKMIVNALTRKSFAFSHMWMTTDLALGRR